MNAIQAMAAQPWVDRLGLTLLHFLWQGAIIAAIYAAARKWGTRTMGPDSRYFLASAALAAMAIVPAVTWMLLSPPPAESVTATFTAPISAARTAPARSISLARPSDAHLPLPGQFLSWVVALWLTGATIFSLRLLSGWILAERARYRMVRPAPAHWQRILDQLKSRVPVARPVRLLVSGLLDAPAAIGWLRPMVLVPAGALAGLPPAQMEALLVHELAHIRRHDYLVHILQSALEAVFFYHPAVWWISGHMRAERELCCDDIAVSITGDAEVYARALAEFDSARWTQRTVMAANGGSLAGRIARLLGQSSTSRQASSGPAIAASVILLAVGAWGLFAQTTDRPQFEAASIKPSYSESIQHVRPLPGRLAADASLPILMQYAYGVQNFQIVGGPDWPIPGRYQIDAKADGNASRARMYLMLQSLLEDRLQLRIHREARDLPTYSLVTAKNGLKLPPPKEGACITSPADAPEEWAGGRMAAPGEMQPGKGLCGSARVYLEPNGARMQGGRVGMPELVRLLSLMLGRSVIDRTGFSGSFDLQVDFVADETTPTIPPPPPGSEVPGPSIAQSLRAQLGLELESSKGPVEVIVVDHAERPSAN